MGLAFNSLGDYSPSIRNRLWIRGLRLDVLTRGQQLLDLPKPYVFEVNLSLKDFLDADEPNIDMAKIKGLGRRSNLDYYESKIWDDMMAGEAGTIAIIDIDRAPSRAYKTVLMYDIVPPLRCKGPSYFLISTGDLHLQRADRQYFRFLTDAERYKLQGHDPNLHAVMRSGNFSLRVTGNAYAVPMVGAVVVPILNMMAESGVGNVRLTADELDALANRKRALADERRELNIKRVRTE